jgi:transposase-like protein
MSGKRRVFSNEFKAKVTVEAIRGVKTISELAREYEVHPNLIGLWKKEFNENLASIFDKSRGVKKKEDTELVDQLYRQIGKLQVELDWLKKKYESLG